ncbi:MAG TPA: helix-turn-helix domain-containing protein, partial [Burkholderiaceae bacterium]|nr:helix-turn-helix domain-containing protein [Burkholderiaceae bacterium]
DAIRDLIRFLRIWYRGVHLSLVVDDGWARFGVALGGAHAGHSELCAMYGASMNHHLHTIIGPQWHAARVSLTHTRPEDVRPYTRILRAPVLFGQLETVIEFPAADLERTRTSSDEHVIRLLRAQLTSLEAEHRMTLAEQVRHLIEVMLGRGDCSAERVADMLSMHRKTLHRRLAREGTTYKAELEAARRDAARRLLAQKKRRVSDVAVALGYSDSVNFTRAFRRWFGVAPRAWQSRQFPLDAC